MVGGSSRGAVLLVEGCCWTVEDKHGASPRSGEHRPAARAGGGQSRPLPTRRTRPGLTRRSHSFELDRASLGLARDLPSPRRTSLSSHALLALSLSFAPCLARRSVEPSLVALSLQTRKPGPIAPRLGPLARTRAPSDADPASLRPAHARQGCFLELRERDLPLAGTLPSPPRSLVPPSCAAPARPDPSRRARPRLRNYPAHVQTICLPLRLTSMCNPSVGTREGKARSESGPCEQGSPAAAQSSRRSPCM